MNIILRNIYPICVLAINFFVSISYFIIYNNRKIKGAFLKMPIILQKMYVGLFVLPLFISPFLMQSKYMENTIYMLIIGIIISIIGMLFIIMSFIKIGIIPSIKKKGGLSKTGVYAIVRHPIYAGTIITQIGLNITNCSMISAFYIIISIILYYLMTIIEEKDLEELFGTEYCDYQKKTTKRIIPFIL
jgi:protein-S-isoprenylcysteine O-methyltransferase Ste14